jgi:hypothetical protein
LSENPALIRHTSDILRKVIVAGPRGIVLGMRVNPQFITQDLLIIASSDANKRTLSAAIPVLHFALKERGETNVPMASDVVSILLQLSFDPTCKAELLKVGSFENGFIFWLYPTIFKK